MVKASAGQVNSFSAIASEVTTPLYSDTQPNERLLQLGKVQNLRVVASRLDGLVFPTNAEFSFWRQVGWPTRRAGFVEGRELRAGCIIPTVAGGICQASNSLYLAAKQAGFTITERHGHTQRVPGAAFMPGDDATVFWNYVDLRFRVDRPVLLRLALSQDHLTVRFLSEA